MSEAIRTAVSDDLEILKEFFNQASDEIRDQRGGEAFLASEARSDVETFAADIDNPQGLLLIGEFENVAVGWAFGKLKELQTKSKIVQVRELFVLPGARGVGVGRTLLSELVSWAKSMDCEGIEGTALPGNREAKSIFEQFGMKTRLLITYSDTDDVLS